MRTARTLWVGLVALLVWVSGPSWPIDGPKVAQASVAVALSLQELVDDADQTVVAVAVDRQSRWEHAEGSKRIVTYTRLQTVQTIIGSPSKSVWVRTLGGVVGKIGQHVAGEPRLDLGQRCLVFLSRLPNDVVVVTGRAQGHYPIISSDEDKNTLRASPDLGKVVPRRGPSESALSLLVGREVGVALEVVRKAQKRRHARR